MKPVLYDGTTIKPGDTFQNGFMGTNVTFVRVSCEPWGDDETGEYFPGQIVVRESWGEEVIVSTDKLRPSINFRD